MGIVKHVMSNVCLPQKNAKFTVLYDVNFRAKIFQFFFIIEVYASWIMALVGVEQ